MHIAIRNNTRLVDERGHEVGKMDAGIYELHSYSEEGMYTWVSMDGYQGLIATDIPFVLRNDYHYHLVPFTTTYEDIKDTGKSGINACLTMLNGYHHTSIDSVPELTNPLTIMSAVAAAGLQCDMDLSMSYPDLREALRAAPVLCALRIEERTHYILAVGYSDEFLIIHDPWNVAASEVASLRGHKPTPVYGQYRFLSYENVDINTYSNKGTVCSMTITAPSNTRTTARRSRRAAQTA